MDQKNKSAQRSRCADLFMMRNGALNPMAKPLLLILPHLISDSLPQKKMLVL